MAEAVFQQQVKDAGLADQFQVDSAGTGRWHVGEPPHRGTREVLRRHGIPYQGRAHQVTTADLQAADYIVAMDSSNMEDLRWIDRQGHLDGKLYRLLDFAPPGSPTNVPDPYYEGNFDYVYQLVDAGASGLLAHIRQERGL
jgi:protein-tyrosine phosphatase